MIFLTLLTCCISNSCEKVKTYPPTPEIKFEALKVHSTVNELGSFRETQITFGFTDGDGDLGVIPPPDGLGDSSSWNFKSRIRYSWLRKMPDGQYVAYHFEKSGLDYDTISIPYETVMDRSEAFNKLLKGKMDVKLPIPTDTTLNTVQVEFSIFDRAGNQSNIELTPDFNLKRDTVINKI